MIFGLKFNQKYIVKSAAVISGFLFGQVFMLSATNLTVTAGQSIQNRIAALQPGDTLFIGAGEYLENLRFPRSGTAANPIVLSALPGEKPVLRSTGTQPLVFGEDYWVMDGIILDQNGAAEDAIRIRGNYNVIRNCEIRNGRRDAIEINSGIGNRIENNIIHDFVWKAGKDAHGIVTDPGVQDLLITGNTIYNCGGDCIQLYASGSDPVSSYSRNINILNNILYTTLGSRSENALDFKGVDGGRIAGNEMYGFDDKAVVVQKGCRNLLFEFNTIRDSERGMEFRGENGKSQKNMRVRNNLIYNISKYYAVKFDWVDSVSFVNNTIAFINARSFRIEEEGLTNSIIKNNLIFQAEEPKIAGTFEVDVSNNGWFLAAAGGFAAAGDVSGDNPGFTAAEPFDFTLQPNSTAIDRGQDVGLNFAGMAPDLGAFEYGLVAAVEAPGPFVATVPASFELAQNWPNPFSTSLAKETRIPLQVFRQSEINITVFNVLGQEIITLFNGIIPQGQQEISWNGRDHSGRLASPGVYFYEVRSAQQKTVKSLIILR